MSSETEQHDPEPTTSDDTPPRRRLSRRGFLRAGAASGLGAATAAAVFLPGAPGRGDNT